MNKNDLYKTDGRLPLLDVKGWCTSLGVRNADLIELIELVVQAAPTSLKWEMEGYTRYKWSCWDTVAPVVLLTILDVPVGGVHYKVEFIPKIAKTDMGAVLSDIPAELQALWEKNTYSVDTASYSMYIPADVKEEDKLVMEATSQTFFDMLVYALNDFMEQTGTPPKDVSHLQDYLA